MTGRENRPAHVSTDDPSTFLRAFTLDQQIEAASQLYQANKLDAAEALYRSVLAAPSPHATANYCLGFLYYVQGRFSEAAAAYRRTIAIRGDDPDAITNLGATMLAQGLAAEAVSQFRMAIAIKPTFTLAYVNLGKALLDLGQFEAAAAACHEAVMLDPRNSIAYVNLSAALLEQGKFADAVVASQRAIILRPDMALAQTNLASAMFKLGRNREALLACRLAMTLEPLDAMMLATLGGVLLELGEFSLSADACERAIALNPSIAMAHFNLAHACKATNRLTEAEAACRKAVALEPHSADYHFLLAHILLAEGDFSEGWSEYEWRLRLPTFVWLRNFGEEVEQPQWGGEDLNGRTILLLTEQGLGDILLFLRYAAILMQRGARVIIAAQEAMRHLLITATKMPFFPIRARPLPSFDVYCPLGSLPGLLGTPGQTLSPMAPYLRAEETLRAAWRDRLGSAGPRVGIIWGGNPETKYDNFRSPRLARILPILQVPGITFIALQAGPARNDISVTPLPAGLIDLGGELHDLAITAAIMSELDLVISSCTAPLHLAGALGVTTWALLPFAPYFPWLLARDETAWYPTMRLYRQTHPGQDWSDVIANVADDLHEFARSFARREMITFAP